MTFYIFILQVELRSQVIISRISLDNCWQWPSHWVDLPLSTALLGSSFRVSPVDVRAGLTPEAQVVCWTPPAAPAQGALGNKAQELLNTVLMKASDWQLRNGHGLFPELWQHKLWLCSRCPRQLFWKHTHFQPNPRLLVPAMAERKQMTQLACWYADTFLSHWWVLTMWTHFKSKRVLIATKILHINHKTVVIRKPLLIFADLG